MAASAGTEPALEPARTATWSGMDKDTQNIFFLGVGIMFAWMAVICICASPQLFRDWLCARCKCLAGASAGVVGAGAAAAKLDKKLNAPSGIDKIRAAELRVRLASECLAARRLVADNPSAAVILHQALAPLAAAAAAADDGESRRLLEQKPPEVHSIEWRWRQEAIPEESRSSSQVRDDPPSIA